MLQGDAYSLRIKVKDKGVIITPEIADDIEVCVGTLKKTYSSGDIKFQNDSWLFPLTQQETFKFENFVELQVRVYFKGGDLKGRKLKGINVDESMSKDVLGDKIDDRS